MINKKQMTKDERYELASTHLEKDLENKIIPEQETGLEELNQEIKTREEKFKSYKGRLAELFKTRNWKYEENMYRHQRKLAKIYSEDLKVSKNILKFLKDPLFPSSYKNSKLPDMEKIFFKRLHCDEFAFLGHDSGGSSPYFEELQIYFPDHVHKTIDDFLNVDSGEITDFLIQSRFRSPLIGIDMLCKNSELYPDLIGKLFDKTFEVYRIEQNRIQNGEKSKDAYNVWFGAVSLVTHCEDTLWKLGKSLGYGGESVSEMLESVEKNKTIHSEEKTPANWYREEARGKRYA